MHIYNQCTTFTLTINVQHSHACPFNQTKSLLLIKLIHSQVLSLVQQGRPLLPEGFEVTHIIMRISLCPLVLRVPGVPFPRPKIYTLTGPQERIKHSCTNLLCMHICIYICDIMGIDDPLPTTGL